MKKFLLKTFPQLNWDTFVTTNELDRFTQTDPGSFPSIQHINKLFLYLKGNYTHQFRGSKIKDYDSMSILLLGDAAHAFPPDLGQVKTSLFYYFYRIILIENIFE